MTQTKLQLFKMPIGYDRWIHGSMILLSVGGTAMIGSASMGLSTGNNMYLLVAIIKQVVFVSIGYIAMIWLANHFTVSFVKSEGIVRIVIATIISLLICLGFKPVGGAKAWIRLSLSTTELSLQPSEFAKISVILIIAAYCGETKKKYRRNWDLISRPIVLIALICVIVSVFQGDFGSMAVIGAIAFLCFLIPSHPQMHRFQLIMIILAFIGVVALVSVLSPKGIDLIMKMPFLQEYQKNRFMSAVDPFYDQYDTGFQLIKGLTSFAKGGLFGVGFGQSINKYTQFPAANTDYILAIMVEELGFTGFIALMLVYGVIIVKNMLYALKIKNERAGIILVGTAGYLLMHMLFNIGGVTGMIPLTGVPLLMISAGGSSTLSFMMAIGICQAVIASFNRKEVM